MSVNLDLKTMLPVIRKAALNRELQFQNPNTDRSECLYSGPCAIGICLTPGQRALLDAPLLEEALDSSIQAALKRAAVMAPADQHDDLNRIQALHDQLNNLLLDTDEQITAATLEFLTFIQELEVKYAH